MTIALRNSESGFLEWLNTARLLEGKEGRVLKDSEEQLLSSLLSLVFVRRLASEETLQDFEYRHILMEVAFQVEVDIVRGPRLSPPTTLELREWSPDSDA